jgi:glyoxylase-like metal-dependent hydrolase (beta-lactamase superfamily II)
MELTKTAVSVQAFRATEGCQAHLVIDPPSRKALVIDPRLDQVDEVMSAAETAGATILYVLDTHTHADHLSGVRQLAERSGAAILAHPGSKTPAAGTLEDGGTIKFGASEVLVLHSPGHTPDSLSLLVDGHLFTGDALFAGGAGRTDFMGGSASDLYGSFRRFESLPPETVVHPGHDYAGVGSTTIARELEANELLGEKDVNRLVARMDAKGPLPANMKSILSFNARGPSENLVSPLELAALGRLENRVSIVDIRSPSEFRARHIDGALNIPFADLDRRMGEIPPDGETILLCQSGIRSEEAARVLGGHGRKARQLEGGMAAWTQTGLPTSGRGGISVERQVQMTIGAFVLTGTALAVLLTPWFFVVPAFMGAGLLFAGISGTCTLALIMARMPWNRREEAGASAACAVAGNAAPAATSSCAAPSEKTRS